MGNSSHSDTNYWRQRSLRTMSDEEWEALCDGCGKCCLHKLQDEETLDVYYTRVACKLLDPKRVICTDYTHRQRQVPDCLDVKRMSPSELRWMPSTCAYRLLAEGKELPEWHHLCSGDADLVHKTGRSVQNRTIQEREVDLIDLEDHIVHWVDS